MKRTIRIPEYTTMKHESEQTRKAQRMGSRYFEDKKRKMNKYACRKGV